MTYYADLSPYEYFATEEKLVNIGWLDRAHPFPKAEPAPELMQALLICTVEDANRTRGVHDCEFCREESPIVIHTDSGFRAVLGMAEIHLDGEDGTRFAAPTLIAHYVSNHNYAPPVAFAVAAIARAQEIIHRNSTPA